MASHADPELIRRFLRGDSQGPRWWLFLRHLVSGCQECARAVRAGAPFLLDASGPHAREAEAVFRAELAAAAREAPEARGGSREDGVPAEDAAYRRAVRRAVNDVLLHGARARPVREKVAALLALLRQSGRVDAERWAALWRTEAGRYPLYEALLQRSWELRVDDPPQMVALAVLATRVAAALGEDGFSPAQVADFAARAWGEAANAVRVAERLGLAERLFARAEELWEQGTRDPELRLRLLDLQASLRGVQGRYGEAVAILLQIERAHREDGNVHLTGRAMISRGIYTGHAGDLRAAISLLRQGAAMIDAELDPLLHRQAILDQIFFLLDAREFHETRSLIWRHRRVIESGGQILRARLGWAEGRALAGLEEWEQAAQALARARQSFLDAGQRGHGALVALDLAAVWMRQGRLAEATELASAAAETLLALRIGEDVLLALSLLQESLRLQAATAGLLQAVADALRRVEGGDLLHDDEE